MASRVLGLVRDQVLAFLFGAGSQMDAFNVAFRIPSLLRDLFAEGAMSAAFVPAFTRRLVSGGRIQAWHLGNQVINLLIVLSGAVVVTGIVAAGPLVRLFAGDFAEVPGKIELTVALTRVLFPFLTLVSVAAALMGMLNALNRFFVPALSPAMFNVATIASAFLIVPFMPSLGLSPIMGIALGGLAGGFGQVALQWAALRKEGFRYSPTLDPADPGLREVLGMMGPGLLGLAAVQINLLVNTVLATAEGTGAVSWLNFAFRLMYLPIGLIGVSIATAALPSISRHAVSEDPAGLRRTFSSAMRTMLMLSVPATAGLMVLATPIVDLLFRHGSFTAADAAATAAAVACYAPGLVGYSTVRLAVPTFYALGNSRTPAAVSTATVLLNLVLNVVLVGHLGYLGLAVGTAAAALVHATVLLMFLARLTGGLDGRRIAVSGVKIAVASLLMAAAVAAVHHYLAGLIPVTRPPLARAGVVAADILAGFLTLGLSAHLLRIGEFAEAIRMVRSRLAP